MNTHEPIESLPGDDISKIVEQMIALAKKTKEPVMEDFNGITLTANPEDNPDTIIRHYDAELDRRSGEHKNSPEYQRRQREAEESKRRREKEFKDSLAAGPSEMPRDDKS